MHLCITNHKVAAALPPCPGRTAPPLQHKAAACAHTEVTAAPRPPGRRLLPKVPRARPGRLLIRHLQAGWLLDEQMRGVESLLQALLQEEREELAHEELLEQGPKDWGRGAVGQEGSLGQQRGLPCLP